MKTRRDVIKAGAAAAAVVATPVIISAGVAGAKCQPIAEQMFGGPVGGSMTDALVQAPNAGEMHEFTFHFLVTGDRETARKVMDHFQSFIETSEGWPAKQTGINTSKITRV